MRILTGLLISAVLLGGTPQSRHGQWQVVAPLTVPATSQVATLLTNGDVLVTGGEEVDYGLPMQTAQLYDTATQTWSLPADMVHARIGHTATLLANGRVLVVGGLGHKLQPLSTAEVYDPARNTWTETAPLPATRFSQSASLLLNGRVLIVGGIVNGVISRSTLIFDPTSGSWQSGPPTIYPHAQQSTVTLPDGRILIAGGYGGSPEIYNPVSQTWTAVTGPGFSAHPVLALLGNDDVLMATGVSRIGRVLTSARLLNPLTDRWQATEPLSVGRNAPIGVELADGRVLVAGGGGSNLQMLRSAVIYDPASHSWQPTAPLHQARSAATAVVLRDGTVLVCGGSWFGSVLASCELYNP